MSSGMMGIFWLYIYASVFPLRVRISRLEPPGQRTWLSRRGLQVRSSVRVPKLSLVKQHRYAGVKDLWMEG